MASFDIILRTQASLHPGGEPTDFVSAYSGIIICTDDETGIVTKVGRVAALRVHCGLAQNVGESLFDACDVHSRELHLLHTHLFEPEEYGFKEKIARRFDAIESDFLILDFVIHSPKWRKLKLGLLAVRKLVDLIGGGCGLAVSLIPDGASLSGVFWFIIKDCSSGIGVVVLQSQHQAVRACELRICERYQGKAPFNEFVNLSSALYGSQFADSQYAEAGRTIHRLSASKTGSITGVGFVEHSRLTMNNITRIIVLSIVIWVFGLVGGTVFLFVNPHTDWFGALGVPLMILLVWGIGVALAPIYVEGDWFSQKWRDRLATFSSFARVNLFRVVCLVQVYPPQGLSNGGYTNVAWVLERRLVRE